LAYLTKEFDPAAGVSLINLQLLFLMQIDTNALCGSRKPWRLEA
jgi:hypothetical protein